MRKLAILALLLFGFRCRTTAPAIRLAPSPPSTSTEGPELPWQFTFGSIPNPPADNPIVRAAQDRGAVIITAVGACSGVIVETGRVLTASHCYPNGKDKSIIVNGAVASVIKNGFPDGANDEMLLKAYTSPISSIAFKDPKIGDAVFAVITQNELRGVVKWGRVTHVQDGTFSTDVVLVKGASGGAVYSADGELVGIVTTWNALMSHGVSSRALKPFVASPIDANPI